jgi:N-dimethylarginine dimethylaminohydrolase
MDARCFLPGDVNFTFEELSPMQRPRNILLLTPDYFDVEEVINPYMEGHVGAVDKALARKQWDALYAIYRQLQIRGIIQEISVLEGRPKLPDMVFCANQSLPWLLLHEEKVVVMSRMKHLVRRGEVQYFRDFYLMQGYKVLEVPDYLFLEGNGDVIPHPGRRLLWAGYGHRSDFNIATYLSAQLQTPVIPLQLVGTYFYHLDTCFLPLDEQTVMLCPSAFDEESLLAIQKVFSRMIPIPEEEAVTTFALNALVLKGPLSGHAVIQKGAKLTIQSLLDLGMEVHEVDTSEFMKSGGSVFCMKMLYY